MREIIAGRPAVRPLRGDAPTRRWRSSPTSRTSSRSSSASGAAAAPTTLDSGEVGAAARSACTATRRRVRRPVQRPARADRPAGSATSSCRRSPAPTGGATRRARCCSASTARRGSPKPALEDHLHRLEEAEKRDHRKLATELDLLSFPSELGGGLAVWHPKGAIVRKLMEDYSRAAPRAAAATSSCTRRTSRTAQLFETSGHLDWYADGMYPPMEMDNGTYYMKPMNCPMHCLIFRSRQRSYRELPLRLFELGTVYRYERAGTLHGLMRIRGFTQDDSHIFCTPEQAPDEIASLLDFVLSVLRAFGFEEFTFNLSTKDPNKYVGTDEGWETATEALRAGPRAPRPRRTRSRRATPPSTARRSTSTSATRSAAAGSCRRSSTTSTIPSASSSSTSAPTTPGTARSCCTGPCSARSSGSSACCSSTTPAPSRRGWRRCRCACCRSRPPTRSTPTKVADRLARRRRPRRRRRRRRPARQAHPQRQAGEAAVRPGRRRRRRRRRHRRRQRPR